MLASSHLAPALTPSPNGYVSCGGLAISTRAASSSWVYRHRPAHRGDGAVAPAALHRGTRLRHLRLVPHRADRVAGPAVPRTDGLCRAGGAVRRTAHDR